MFSIKSNRQKDFEKIVKNYSTELYSFAFWLCNNHSITEDLVQETFLRAWKSLDKLQDEKKIKAWLFTILRRENFRRFERKTFDFIDYEETILEDQNNPDAQQYIECLQLHKEILKLEIKFREPLLLQTIGGYNSYEISEILDLNIYTVNIRLYRARNQLMNIYNIKDIKQQTV